MILFNSFFDANTAREFLQNTTNFKETEQNNFVARWYKLEDENMVSEVLRKKISKYTNKFLEQHLKKMNIMNNMSNFGKVNMSNNMNMGNNMNMNMGNFINNGVNMNTGFNGNNNMTGMNNGNFNQFMQYKGGMNGDMDKMKNTKGMPNMQMNGMQGVNNMNMNMNNSQNNSRKNTSINVNTDQSFEEKKGNNFQQVQNGKYTCRFEIQIENDKEFQVARRLIGSKVKLEV